MRFNKKGIEYKLDKKIEFLPDSPVIILQRKFWYKGTQYHKGICHHLFKSDVMGFEVLCSEKELKKLDIKLYKGTDNHEKM